MLTAAAHHTESRVARVSAGINAPPPLPMVPPTGAPSPESDHSQTCISNDISTPRVSHTGDRAVTTDVRREPSSARYACAASDSAHTNTSYRSPRRSPALVADTATLLGSSCETARGAEGVDAEAPAAATRAHSPSSLVPSGGPSAAGSTSHRSTDADRSPAEGSPQPSVTRAVSRSSPPSAATSGSPGARRGRRNVLNGNTSRRSSAELEMSADSSTHST